MNGIELISIEHGRCKAQGGLNQLPTQCGELALAAACYATPEQLYVMTGDDSDCVLDDPWPWNRSLDLRNVMGERKHHAGCLPADPATLSLEERIALLAKAGAMLAVELDRLLLQRRPPQLGITDQ